jgi:hypothetical protein
MLNIIADGDRLIFSVCTDLRKGIGQGAEPDIGDHLPGGKSCRGNLEDENASQGHGRPLPCPLEWMPYDK